MEAGSSTYPSNRDHFEALESSTFWMKEQMAETTTNMTHMQGAITSVTNATEENMKAVEGMRRDLQAILARLGGGANGANRGQTPRVEGEQLVDGRETHISKSTRGEPRPRQPLRLGGRAENEHEVVERWLREEESDPEVDNHARTEERFGGSRYREEMPYGRIHEDARRHERPRRDHHYHDKDEGNRFNHRGPRRPHYRGGDYEDDDGNRFNNRGPRRPKIDFPKFNGGDPHEWLDKADHYFYIYEVPRIERVATACFFLDGKASKWWRWIRAQYEKEGRRLGWTAFEKELLMQFGPSPIINHHGQLAKLKQDGKVHAYVEEFRQLQTLVRGWSEEALIGTFVDGLKPWIAKELKLKQPTRLQEAMRMAEILEESHHFEKRHVKDQVANKVYKPLYSTGSWKGKEGTTGDSRSKGKEVKKLSREELDEYIKKGLCFKCGEKWSRDHQCKKAKVMCMIGIEDEQLGETSEEEHGHEESSSDEESEEAELSLNAMSGVQKPSTMRLMAWVGKHEMTLLVDSGSTHNFINSRVLSKVGLHGEEVDPFDVKVANGERLRCEMVVRTVKMNVQGIRIAADLHVLSLVGLDVVLGNAWLRGIGKVVTDYEKMTMEFKLGGKKRTWTALASKEPRPCEANMFEKLCKGGAHCFAIVMGQNRGDEGQEEKYSDGNEELPQGVKTVLERHKEVLEVPTSLPPSREFDHRIVLKDASKPVNVPPYRYAHFQKGEIERQVEEMLASGLIRPSTSPFSSPVLLVRKKDGSWHFCTDYRALNEATVRDRFPIPTVDEMLDELHGAHVFTKLDLRAGYHQIRMKEEDTHKTAFRTHSGHYEYLVMPFGLCNAPSTFQAAMNAIFKPFLRKFVLVFFDDILVYSKNVEEHLEQLERVLMILKEHHFFIKASKCAFMQEELEYLGHIISGQGVKVDQRKVEAMVDWPLPKDVSALQGFLGLTGYYRRFVQGYGLIAKPLTSMLKKEGFEWTEDGRRAFENLKRAMTKTPVLALPDFKKPFAVYTDASGEGIGAVLAQERRPIAYISKALGPMKKAWSTYAREMLAVVHAVKVWRPYLLGRKFTIVTDQQALRHLLEQKIVTPEQQKFLVKLLGFEYDIIYQPGKENKVADALSRKEGSPMMWTLYEDEAEHMALSGAEWRIWDKLREAVELDARSQEIIEKLESPCDGVTGFKWRDGLIYYKSYVYVPDVPNLRKEILTHFHHSKEGGHSGWLRTYMRIKHFFYWEGLKRSVKKWVAECDVCQKAKHDTRAPTGLLQPLPIPEAIWEDLSMDFVEGLPASQGYEVILVVVDRLSKYAHFIPLKHPFTMKSVAKAFVDNVVKLHGFPRTIVTDRDRVFMSSFWKEVFALQGSKMKTSSSYHPQTDGQTEVVNRTLEQYLRCYCHDEQARWMDYMSWAEYWYNTTYHSSITLSPFEVVYGRKPPTLVAYERGTAKNAEVEEALITRDEILAKAKRELKKAQSSMKKYYDKRRRLEEFEPGDFVYLKLQPYGQKTMKRKASYKLEKRYYGPFKVAARVGEVAYRLELPPTSRLHPVFHVSLLKRRVGDPSLIVEELPSFDEEGRMLLQPATILEYKMVPRGRIRRKIWRVLVQWRGLPREEATWEDYDDIALRFPQFTLEDKGTLNGRGNERIPSEDHGLHGHDGEDKLRDAAPVTLMGAHDMPIARAAEAPQPCHGKPRASTQTCLDKVPQQDFGHQPSQPVADDQEWLPPAATSGDGAPPVLAVTEQDVTSMAWGVGGASPPMEENGGGATV